MERPPSVEMAVIDGTEMPETPPKKVPDTERTRNGEPLGAKVLSDHPAAVRARQHRERHGDRARARGLLSRAIASGQLVPGPCEVGGDCKGRIDGHHDDYSRPLDVRWLCKRHHALTDRRPKAPRCPNCSTEWSRARSGALYCRPCSRERMRKMRAKGAPTESGEFRS